MNYACKMHRLFILCFFFSLTGALDDPNHLSINCGGAAAPATSLGGRGWGGDAASKGSSSTKSTTLNIPAVDPVPYGTARISRSQFSYTFPLTPGQKFIRFHFNPVSYHGFESFIDFFTVEAGPFTLLANFSASVTARALSQNIIVKEFCVMIQRNQPFRILFSPEIGQSESNYAFINGIEIISVPSTLSYCHGGDSGIGVLGQKSVIYIDSSTALERVYHQNLKRGSVSFGNDIGGMFGIWASILHGDAKKGSRNLRFPVCVDLGFRYLVRVHLFEVRLDLDFRLMIDDIVVLTNADLLQQSRNQTRLWYNYMLMVQGKKRVSKHIISISLHSQHELVDRQGPVEGFEVFKLSNYDLSLASPNPQPSSPRPSSHSILKSLLGRINASATLLFTMISLLNIVVHLLQKMWGTDFSDEENEPSTRPKQPYRRFSLAEIQSATENFHSGYVIGKGGFGNVYKGLIDNRREIVAIKRLKPDSNQGEQQFWTEVEMLSVLRHVNLVSLLGFCAEQKEMMLVYEYMPCGTLADHLFKLPQQSLLYRPLSWKQRLKICIGAGRALDYLHTGHGIIHRDVKSSNILLDDKFVAKVSDFGLAKTGFGSDSQTQHSTQVKGTRGYLDPDYCETRKPTKKSDIFSFGVVLLEVLCGRRALERHSEEDKCWLTMWAMDNILKGQVDRIVFPTLMAEASPASLKTFVKVAKRCLHDEPKKRPAIVRVVMKLELALQQQEKAESLDPNEITSVENLFSSTDRYQKEETNSTVPRKKINIDHTLPQMDNAKPSSPNETRNVADNDRQRTSNAQTVTSLPIEQINSTMIDPEKKVGRSSMLFRISRKLLPWDAFWKTRKPSNKTYLVGTSVSAPMSRRTSNITVDGNTVTNKRTDEMISAPAAESTEYRPLKGIDSKKKGKMNFMVPDGKINVADNATLGPARKFLPHINLRIFTISELRAATRNFRPDSVLGQGGFGTVYKGQINEKSSDKAGSGTLIAVKKLNPESLQGFQEWQSEVDFLGRLSHPNLVKLFGYCSENNELLLVYEFMAKGSLENHLFRRGASVQPLPWDIRLKILIGAARGLAFLHAQDKKVIYRDFKTSNILLDGSYKAKVSDFGLAKFGPVIGHSHVTTQVVGTYGYAAPEYVATGHLYVKSDVYGFGVVVLEMLTGLRALDMNRPRTQQILVDWMKPSLYNKKKLKHVVDFRLEGRYNIKSALRIAQLAVNCLENEPRYRPSMEEIVGTLESIYSYDLF